MLRRFARLLSPITLVAYLIATTWATSPHTHEHALLDQNGSACSDSESCEHHCHAHHHHGHAHVHRHSHPVAKNTENCHRPVTPCPGHGNHEEENCAACKLLSAKSLASPQVTVIVVTEAIAELPQPSVQSPEAPVLGRPLSRGPPARG